MVSEILSVQKKKNEVSSTYRRITKDKEENTRKWQKRGSERAKTQNFEKQKIHFFLIRFLGQNCDM